MSDARWIDVADDVTWAEHHFGMAVKLFELGGMDGEGIEPYRNRMAFMQAMQSGYTSLEGGIERIFDILGEAKPTGADYHAVLVRRASRLVPDERPPILSGPVAAAMDDARRFRHVARRNYNNFRVSEAKGAVEAARRLAAEIVREIDAFRRTIDPPSDASPNGSDGRRGTT